MFFLLQYFHFILLYGYTKNLSQNIECVKHCFNVLNRPLQRKIYFYFYTAAIMNSCHAHFPNFFRHNYPCVLLNFFSRSVASYKLQWNRPTNIMKRFLQIFKIYISFHCNVFFVLLFQ